jgi:uncharacterized lipoprotein (TIGR02269 family)
MSLRFTLPCLLLLLLAACATTTPLRREDFEAPEDVVSWEQAHADPSCVVLLCEEERCGLWRCGDLKAMTAEELEAAEQALAKAERSKASQILRTRGPMVLRPPVSWTSSSRYWGYPLALPGDSEPVFEIPWNNWKSRAEAERLSKIHWWCLPPGEPMEKHHIFPQRQDLARWFEIHGIRIHDFTIPLRRSFHVYLHSGGARGGMWNAAWEKFQREHDDASPEEIWRFAGELMRRFGVHGEFVPYCRSPASDESRDR